MTYFKDPENGERDALLHFVEGGVYPKLALRGERIQAHRRLHAGDDEVRPDRARRG